MMYRLRMVCHHLGINGRAFAADPAGNANA
jgi:hypothetical protein